MSSIYRQLIILFSLIFIGFISKKVKVLDQTADKKISRLVVNIALPATILYSVSGKITFSVSETLTVFMIAILTFIFIPFISFIVSKIFKLENTFRLMLDYSNLGFMGLPIIASVLGDTYVFYVSIFMMIFNLSIFSYGIIVLNSNGDKAKFNFKRLLTPGIIASILAIIIFFFKFPIPSLLASILGQVNNITTPVAMLMIGSMLADVSIRDTITDKRLFLFVVLKLMVYPALVWCLFYPFISDNRLVILAVILTGLPTGANVSMLCAEYGGNADLVAKGTFISTVFSLITIPIMLFLLPV